MYTSTLPKYLTSWSGKYQCLYNHTQLLAQRANTARVYVSDVTREHRMYDIAEHKQSHTCILALLTCVMSGSPDKASMFSSVTPLKASFVSLLHAGSSLTSKGPAEVQN